MPVYLNEVEGELFDGINIRTVVQVCIYEVIIREASGAL